VPVEELTRAFDKLDLSSKQRKTLFEVDKFWFRRVFGGDNGSSAKLLVPPARPVSSPSIGIGQFASTERGLLLGATFKMSGPGMLFGARYAYLHGIKYLPDVVLEADGHVTTRDQAYFSGEVLLSYPIDGSMKLLFGRAFVADVKQFDRQQWDWIAGVEFRMGRMRFNGAARSWGPVTQSSKEFSLSYFF
jgi:hypothetical protein